MDASNSPASLRCLGETLELATATVIPRPIAAGVFGMARTIALVCGSVFATKEIGRPAMIDSASVVLPRCGVTDGNAAGAVCGFTAITTAVAAPLARAGLSFTPRLAKAF